MATLVLLRHGESEWNRANLFTGWQDVGLTDGGEAEARDAARMLAEAGIAVDVVHTSVLVRAIRTAEITLAALGRSWVPVRRHWRLNERHYGDLEGTNKRQATERWGEAQVKEWRRSYATPPPPLAPDDPRHPRFDPRYAALPPDVLPAGECLADVVDRMLPYWHDVIVPDLRAGLVVLVVAHGNSLRALVKHLDRISDDDICELNIPTGIPLVYELDNHDPCRPAAPGRYLATPDVVAAKVAAVAQQAIAGPSTPSRQHP